MSPEPDDPAGAPRHLAAGAFVSLAVQVAGIAMAVPTSIVIARATGAEGTGAFGLAMALVTSASVVFGIGLTAGITYLVSRGQWPARAAWRETRTVAVLLGLAGAGVIVGAQQLLADSVLEGVTLTMAVALGLLMPLLLVWNFSSSVTLATERYELLGFAQLAQALLAFAGTVGLVLAFGATGAVIGYAISYPLAYVFFHRRLARSLPPAEPAAPALRPAVQFGVRSWGAELLQMLNYRLDLFILNAFVERAVVGRYSIAVSLTALGWVLPTALESVLFPRAAKVAGQGDDQGDAPVLAALRHGLVLSTASLLVLLALIATIPLVYGDDFSAAVRYGLVLLPGVLAIGFGRLLNAVIAGRGFPQYQLYNALIVTPLTVGLYFVLIPWLGGTGAAVASTLSYVASAAISAYFFTRATGISVAAALHSPRAVIDDYATALRSLRERVSGPRRR